MELIIFIIGNDSNRYSSGENEDKLPNRYSFETLASICLRQSRCKSSPKLSPRTYSAGQIRSINSNRRSFNRSDVSLDSPEMLTDLSYVLLETNGMIEFEVSVSLCSKYSFLRSLAGKTFTVIKTKKLLSLVYTKDINI